MDAVQRALVRFDKGQACSQAVFAAFADQLGIVDEAAERIATGFGGGMGRMGETCGAVSGAIMVIGARYGGTDPESKEKTYEMVREFVRRFNARHGIIVCKELLQCDLSTPEGRAHAAAADLHSTVCSDLVRDTAEILLELV